MAILKSGDLTFDFQYRFFFASIHYHIYFRWKGENIIKNSVLKREGGWWPDLPDGAFWVTEDEKDGLIPLIKKVLETGKADSWDPLEPALSVALFPGDYFPFIPSLKPEYLPPITSQSGNSNQPCHEFTFLALVGNHNFKGCVAMSAEGPCLHMVVKRSDLELFLKELEAEYADFLVRCDVAGYLKAMYGECLNRK